MKILIIAHDVGSKDMGMLFRPYYIAQGLKARGHEVEVITASYSRVRRKNPVIRKDLETHEVEGIPYHWIKSLKFSGNSIQRALGMFWFSFKLWKFAGYFAKQMKADAVIASSPHPLIIWGAHRIAKKTRAKLIFEVRDIWPLSMHELSGMRKCHPFYILCQWAEDFAYKNSDKVVSLLPYAYEHMKSRGLAQSKFLCIPNGLDEADFKSAEALPAEIKSRIEDFRSAYPQILGYAGAHGLANSLESLVDAAALIKPGSGIGVLLVGDGAEKPALIEKAKSKNLENVLFIPPISKRHIPAILDLFDVAYIGLKKSPLFKFGISPNKLIDYMAAGKPVLYAIDTDRDPVAESSCGVKVPADDPQALALALTALLQRSESELKEMGQRGKIWVEKNLSYPVLLDQLEEVLK